MLLLPSAMALFGRWNWWLPAEHRPGLSRQAFSARAEGPPAGAQPNPSPVEISRSSTGRRTRQRRRSAGQSSCRRTKASTPSVRHLRDDRRELRPQVVEVRPHPSRRSRGLERVAAAAVRLLPHGGSGLGIPAGRGGGRSRSRRNGGRLVTASATAGESQRADGEKRNDSGGRPSSSMHDSSLS